MNPTIEHSTSEDLNKEALSKLASMTIHQHTRGNRITVTIPPEILALADLTGRPASDIVADLLSAQVSAIRTKAESLLLDVVI